eukprot:GEMP01067544.1.p1 GENE.GEMP01067544.1~~GEMP01067544.1.p1  ORF type:complete len:123 (+),score=16.32 GEMP01067544.1:300-668(+)
MKITQCAPPIYSRFCIVYCRPILTELRQQCIAIERWELTLTTSDSGDCLGNDPHLPSKSQVEALAREEVLQASKSSQTLPVPPPGGDKALRVIRAARQDAERGLEDSRTALRGIKEQLGSQR